MFAQSLPRARALVADGATTIEIKSGYGLDLDSERKMLRVARRIGEALGIGVSTTLLAAHALPPEFAGRGDAYIDEVCDQILPAIAREGLADAVDAFCERIAFTPEQTRRVFASARELGLPVKLHADQLSDLGGAALAAEFGARSAEHLEHTSETAYARWPQHGTVAVLLPGAYYALRETKLPPIDGFRNAGVPIAIATDCNPGTSPLLVAAPCDEHGVHAVPPDARRIAARRNGQCRARARPGGSRLTRSGQASGFRRLEYRAAGRSVLLDRRRARAARRRGRLVPSLPTSREDRRFAAISPCALVAAHGRGMTWRAAVRSARLSGSGLLHRNRLLGRGPRARFRRGRRLGRSSIFRRVRPHVAVTADRDLALARLAVASAHRRSSVNAVIRGAEDSSPRAQRKDSAPASLGDQAGLRQPALIAMRRLELHGRVLRR